MGTYDFYKSVDRETRAKYRVVGKNNSWKTQKKIWFFWKTIEKEKSLEAALHNLSMNLAPQEVWLLDKNGKKL